MNQLFSRLRALFVISDCYHCNIYKRFIDRLNMKLIPEKRIRVIHCDSYYEYGIPNHPLIEIVAPHLDGIFPTLFFDGLKIRGANTKEELESFLDGLLHQDLIISRYNPNMFNKKCSYVESGYFKGKISCS